MKSRFVIQFLFLAGMTGVQSQNINPGLVPFKYHQFALGSIKASGWLQNQLELSADGLGGHLFDFYRYVKKSMWLGGDTEYSELHESAPYWFNYIVPLAWTLDDERLKNQARQFLDYTLDHQSPDGWLGPETTRQTRGMWARALLCFGLTQYAEADPTQTERIVTALHKFVALTNSMLKDNFTGLIQDKSEEDNFDPYGFGLSRTHELPISLMWLYENHPKKEGELILETIELMFEGGRKGSRDWTTFFVDGVFPKVGTPNIKTSGFTHGVNLAQGLRYPTVLYRRTNNESLVQQTYDAVNMTAQYHTSLSGSIIGDEHLGGQSPQRGSELCMAVESMFSYAYLYRFHGSNDFADRAERAAFNAFPVSMAGDWWSHQYVAQTNQPWARNLSEKPYFNVVTYGNTFGLEPNFPCCTVNHPQAYPKYVASSYVLNGPNEIVHILLGPTTLNTKINGKNVRIECKTNYPFSGTLRYSISTETNISFAIRIPQWATPHLARSSSALDSSPQRKLTPEASSLQHYEIKRGVHKLTIILPMEIEAVYRGSSVSIYRGPLLYAADIPFDSTSHTPLNWTDRTPLPAAELDPRSKDYVLTPASEWRYAIDPATVTENAVRDVDAELPERVWTREGPPMEVWVDAYPIDWPVVLDTAGLPLEDVIVERERKTRLRLIPYGAAKLHIAEFPVARFSG